MCAASNGTVERPLSQPILGPATSPHKRPNTGTDEFCGAWPAPRDIICEPRRVSPGPVQPAPRGRRAQQQEAAPRKEIRSKMRQALLYTRVPDFAAHIPATPPRSLTCALPILSSVAHFSFSCGSP
ncbi:hypothetical protein L209DRAFT_42463 [Thermothelomyces heterothallicus CBS 203.75]